MQIKNKGISPILATLILITITVLAGTLIFKFGNESLAQLSPPADCSELNFDAGLYQELDNKVSFEVSNTGNTNIESFILKVKDSSDNIETHEISLQVKPAESERQTLDFEISENAMVSVIPQIKNTQGKTFQCGEEFEKSVELNLIGK